MPDSHPHCRWLPIQIAALHADLGWPAQQVLVIDEDLGVSGSGIVERSGFARLTAEVALGHVGIVLGLEVSRLARNNADWYRLLDLCGLTDTLIGGAAGLYDHVRQAGGNSELEAEAPR